MARLFSLLIASTAVLQAASAKDTYCPGGLGTTSVNDGQTIFAGCGYGCKTSSVDLGEITSACFPFCDRAVATTTAPCSIFVSDSADDYTSKVNAASSSYFNGEAEATTTSTSTSSRSTSSTSSSSSKDKSSADANGTTAGSTSASTTSTGTSSGTLTITSKAQSTGTGTASSAASSSTSSAGASANVGRAWGAWAAAGLAAAGPGVAAVFL